MRKRKKKVIQQRFPPKLTRKQKFQRFLFNTLGLVLGLTGILACIRIKFMDDILSGTTFFFLFACIGVFLSGAISFSYSERLIELTNRVIANGFLSGVFVLLTFGIPAVADIVNRLDAHPGQCSEYKIERREYSHKKRRYRQYHYLFVTIKNEEERLTLPHDLYHSLTDKPNVEICVAEGLLGFDYVSEISPALP